MHWRDIPLILDSRVAPSSCWSDHIQLCSCAVVREPCELFDAVLKLTFAPICSAMSYKCMVCDYPQQQAAHIFLLVYSASLCFFSARRMHFHTEDQGFPVHGVMPQWRASVSGEHDGRITNDNLPYEGRRLDIRASELAIRGGSIFRTWILEYLHILRTELS